MFVKTEYTSLVLRVPYTVLRRTHYAGGISKCSSTRRLFRPTVHTNSSWKWSFSKTLFKPDEFSCVQIFWERSFQRSSNWRNLKTPVFRFSEDRNILKRNSKMELHVIYDFPVQVFLKDKSKIIGDWSIFKFPRCSVSYNIWCVLGVKSPF